MKREQCTFLQGSVEDSLQTSSSDTRQLSLLSGMPMLAKSSENAQQKDGSQDCKCGKATSDCLIHPSTRDRWIASMQDSLARTLALPENKQALAHKRAVASTVKSSASLAWFDPSSCSWRTSQQSFLTDSEQSWQTLPRSGMTRSGFAYALPIVGRLTTEIDGGYLATPTTMSNQLMPSMMKHKGCRNLVEAMLPTPTAHDRKKGAYPSEYNRNTPGIAVILGGKPSPMFQEWQMGWPINHTALKQSAMGRSRSKQQQPTDCLGAE